MAKVTGALTIGSSMVPPRRSKRLKGSALISGTTVSRLLARRSQSEDDCLASTEVSTLEETTAHTQPPQQESVRACPTQSSDHRQRENQPTSCPSNGNSLFDASAPLEQRPVTSTANNGYGSKPNLPTRVLPTKRTFKHKPSGKSKRGRPKLLELPLDILCLIADNLDVVARACLRYAHPALGYWCNLSLCARSGIVSLLLRDGASIPEQLLGVASRSSVNGHCSKYHEILPKYCVTCRCYGHLSHCPECQIRTCAREGT